MRLFAEKRKLFPDPRAAEQDGLLMVGGPLNTQTLLEAYSFGIFPWPQEGLPVLWFSPPRRGILDFKDLHVSRSFQKVWRRHPYRLSFNEDFGQVIEACARSPRPGQDGTWITSDMQRAYLDFHQDGYAHSVECWRGSQLVGGLYGVYVAGVFAGESMFYKENNASKLCLYFLIETLRQKGQTWMDMQMVTEGLKSWGGKYISREQFLRRLEESKKTTQTFI